MSQEFLLPAAFEFGADSDSLLGSMRSGASGQEPLFSPSESSLTSYAPSPRPLTLPFPLVGQEAISPAGTYLDALSFVPSHPGHPGTVSLHQLRLLPLLCPWGRSVVSGTMEEG